MPITDPIGKQLREEANQLTYWKQQLAGLPILQLPTDRSRSPIQSFRGARQCVALPQPLSEAIASLSQKEGVTLYMTLLAAFKTLLYRYTGQTDIVVGTVTAGRNQPEIQQLIGCFVNTLVLRTDLKDNPTFQQLLERVREVTLGAFAHQDLPFEKLVEALHPERNLGQNPLFQVAFVLQPPMSGVDSMLNWSQLDIDTETAKFDLTLELQETSEGLVGRFEYSTDLFDAETIERMVGHFQTLLEGIVAHPDQKIAELPLLTDFEWQQLVAWNNTKTDYPKDACIHQLFEAQVEIAPDAIALIFEDKQLTYKELNVRANQLAHYLQNLGVEPEVLVGICVERSLETIIGLLGILKAGGAFLPLDPAYPKERLAFMLEDSQVPVLLTQRQLLVESLPKHQGRVVCLDTDWPVIERQSEENPECSLTPNNLAYVIYTSGSTGQPKGVLVEHSSISNLATAEIRLFNVQPESRVLQFASLSFDVSVWEVVMTLLAGAALVLATRDSLLPGAGLIQLLRDFTITTVTLPPSVLAVLPAEDLPALQTIIVTGEACPPDIVAKWASGRRFFNAYGPTESAVSATVAECNDSSKSPPIGRPLANKQIYLLDAQLQPVPIGLPGELYIGGDGLARGYLNRPELTAERFILNPFSDEPDSRLYKTGDLVRYLPDGNIEFLGRIDHQVKIRGFRIELGEIEAVLSQHPDVQVAVVAAQENVPGQKRLVAYVVSKITAKCTFKSEAIAEFDGDYSVKLHTENISINGISAIGVPDTCSKGMRVRLRLVLPGDAQERCFEGSVAWCQGNQVGFELSLTPTEEDLIQQSIDYLLETQGFLKFLQRTTAGKLRGFLKNKLPDYMVPSSFVFPKTLPLTPNGKIDRQKLLASAATIPALEQNFVAPRTPVEEALVGIWTEVLGLEQVGIRDNFFELGGHSLLVTQIVTRMRDTFQVELSLTTLFEFPTVAALADSLEIAGRKASKPLTSPIQPVSRHQDLPLSLTQEQLWFLCQLAPDTPFYNEPITIRLPGSVNIAALERSISEIIRRHEVLRTTFTLVDGQPVMVIRDAPNFTVPVVNLEEFPETGRETEALRLATLEAKRPFDLSQGPLLRATLMQLGETDCRLFLTLHHIAIDGISLYGVFLKELATLYTTFSLGLPSPFPELPIQFADFAHWQRQWLQGEVLANRLAYWKQQLADLPTLQLPSDRSRSPIQSFRGARQCLALPQSLTEMLKDLSRKQGVTLFMTLMAAFQTLLYRYTGQNDIPVGTVANIRNRQELEGMIGYFLNTLVIRTDLSGNPSFEELLVRVREVTLEAYTYQELPFQKLVEEIQPERNLSYNPLFQVALVLAPPLAEMDGWRISQLDVDTGTAKFDLYLELDERSSGIIGRLEYNTELFDAATINRMLEHFQTLLKGIVANPEQKISELPLLSEFERQQLAAWNDTETDYPKDACIHQLFEEQVKLTPDAIALIFEEQQLTYQELNQRANQLAHHLRNLGVGAEVLVGICVERSLEMVVGILGILKAGGAYVPLDPTYPKERLAFMLEDASVPVLLTQARLIKSLPKHQARVVCLDTDWQVIERQSEANPSPQVTPDKLAYVIYTSGSTGKPKGVTVPHRSVNRLVLNTNYISLQQKDIVAFASNFSFDAATFEIWGAFLNGAKLVVITKDVALSPHDFAAQIHEQGVTVLFLTTALFNLIAREIPSAFHLVQHLAVGGEAMEPKWVKEVLKKGSPQRLLNGYGPTENTTFSTWYLVEDVPEEATTVPIGCPISNTHCFLLDAQKQLVPIGVPGELYLGGDGLARGYLNRPELTADRFILNPFSHEQGDRLYKTGDLARYLPDGNIEFLGRIDHQVKIRGFRIELGEIEAVLSQHPDVQESVVIKREDASGNQRLVAYIVSHLRLEHTDVGSLRNFLKQKLPDYMVPSGFLFLNHLPLTPNGKVDRKALPEPDALNPELETNYVAPQTDIEQAIATVWQQVLHLEKVGVDDNFFDLGGHSLLMAQAHSKLREVVDRDVSMIEMFKYPTISSLAKYLSDEPEEKSSVGQSRDRINKQKDAINRQKQKQRLQGKNKNG
ncbi:amino acid adenylation domain-containing protein [Microcoleus sp. F4-D5]|uniref:amino acid adenylation domain-containing protein n=1 Tax=Microcoleus sp. F4-D5 TaxID=2818760 RepID=UPI004040ACDB